MKDITNVDFPLLAPMGLEKIPYRHMAPWWPPGTTYFAEPDTGYVAELAQQDALDGVPIIFANIEGGLTPELIAVGRQFWHWQKVALYLTGAVERYRKLFAAYRANNSSTKIIFYSSPSPRYENLSRAAYGYPAAKVTLEELVRIDRAFSPAIQEYVDYVGMPMYFKGDVNDLEYRKVWQDATYMQMAVARHVYNLPAMACLTPFYMQEDGEPPLDWPTWRFILKFCREHDLETVLWARRTVTELPWYIKQLISEHLLRS